MKYIIIYKEDGTLIVSNKYQSMTIPDSSYLEDCIEEMEISAELRQEEN